MKKAIFVAVAALSTFPAVAMAHTQPFIGIGYASTNLSGHSSRPGATLFGGQRFGDNIQVRGSATLARSFYSFDGSVGKDIAASSAVTFEPYVGAGLVSMNYNQQETGYRSYTQGLFTAFDVPYTYTVPASIQDSYAMAGANVGWMVSPRVQLAFGGGYGHTLTVLNGNGGAVYKGEAQATFGISKRWATDLQVSYLHLPGASLTSYGAGVAYHF